MNYGDLGIGGKPQFFVSCGYLCFKDIDSLV